MSEAGFFAPQKVNRTGLVLVIALHAAGISALALSKMEMPPIVDYGTTEFWNIPIDKPPPETEKVQDQRPPADRPVTTSPKPIVETPLERSDPIDTVPTVEIVRPLDPPTISIVEPPIADPAPPVRIAAIIDPRIVQQPPYPASEQRRGGEGVVKVRVLIGADGRVKAVEKVSATSDAFWIATERHALRAWRFRPATLDGRPVESWREMTVRFELTADV